MSLRIADFFSAGQEGREAARAGQTRKSLASYMQGDQSALANAYANDPQAAMQAQTFQGGQKKQAEEQFGKLSAVYTQTKNPQVYSQWRQAGIAAGHLPQDTPEQVVDPADMEGSIKAAQAYAQAYGGMSARQDEPRIVAPGSALVGNDGKLIYERPFAPEKPDYQLYDGADGPAWLPKPTGAPQGAAPAFSGMGTPGQPPVATGGIVGGADPSQFVASIGDIVKPFGGTIGSTTGGKHNTGSLHPGGNAVDIPLGDWRNIPADKQEAMIAALQQQPGIRVRDERQRPPGQKVWSGPHLHVERVGESSGGPRAIPIAGVRPKPKADGAPSGYTWGPDGRTLVAIPGGPADPASQAQSKGAPTEGERKAATLLKRLTGSLTQLETAVRESPESASPSLASEATRRIPLVGQAVSNTITPAARQRVEAAQLDILDAALTLGTGAAYTREQLEGYRKSYFPQIGDDKTTIEDKAARLNNVIEAAHIASGRAAPDRATTKNGPKPGTVQGGYRFKGGNPANQNSWEKL